MTSVTSPNEGEAVESNGPWVIDPPEGWLYGFPKAVPDECLNNDDLLTKWLLEQGYPKDRINIAMNHSRYWRM